MDSFMQEAIAEAKRGLSEGGIPIGSVLVRQGRIIGRGHNRRVQETNPMHPSKINCLINAGTIGGYNDTVLYSTLMPCYLCAGAVVQFNIPKVVVGESQTFPGAKQFMQEQGVEVIDLSLDECVKIMKDFIRNHPALWNEDIGT